MIRHIVCWKLKEKALGASLEENALLIRDKLESLKAVIPEIVEMEVGLDIRDVESNWHLVLNCTFRDAADLAVYQEHPAHVAFKEFIMERRELRAAVDYEY